MGKILPTLEIPLLRLCISTFLGMSMNNNGTEILNNHETRIPLYTSDTCAPLPERRLESEKE